MYGDLRSKHVFCHFDRPEAFIFSVLASQMIRSYVSELEEAAVEY